MAVIWLGVLFLSFGYWLAVGTNLPYLIWPVMMAALGVVAQTRVVRRTRLSGASG